MKNILITISVLLLIGVGIYFYLQNKVATVDLDNNSILIEEENTNQTNDFVDTLKETEPTTKTEDKNITNNNQKNMQATFNTNKGEFTVELFRDLTPKTVANFVKLVESGFYNDTKFHRVIEGFMNQGGDPLSKDDTQKASWGTGGPGYQFEDEITAQNKNDIWTLSMANAGPDTNGSQFFINVASNNGLDTKHTVFGKVISGTEVITAINKVATDPSDKPLEPVIIKTITLK